MRMFAVSMVRRGVFHRRPNSICATTGHTEPGTYFPSWLTKNTASRLEPRGRDSQASEQRKPHLADENRADKAEHAGHDDRAEP